MHRTRAGDSDVPVIRECGVDVHVDHRQLVDVLTQSPR